MLPLLAVTSSRHSSADTAAALTVLAGAWVFISLIVLFFVALSLVVHYMIVQRAGYNPWLSLLMLVPGVNFIVLLVFAFSEWPVQRENRALRAQLGQPAGFAPPPGYGPGSSIQPS
jgi:hypothetical protein